MSNSTLMLTLMKIHPVQGCVGEGERSSFVNKDMCRCNATIFSWFHYPTNSACNKTHKKLVLTRKSFASTEDPIWQRDLGGSHLGSRHTIQVPIWVWPVSPLLHLTDIYKCRLLFLANSCQQELRGYYEGAVITGSHWHMADHVWESHVSGRSRAARVTLLTLPPTSLL